MGFNTEVGTFMTFDISLSTSVHCYVAVTCPGVNDWWATAIFKATVYAHVNPTQVTTHNIPLTFTQCKRTFVSNHPGVPKIMS